jgi:hypothetical protein
MSSDSIPPEEATRAPRDVIAEARLKRLSPFHREIPTWWQRTIRDAAALDLAALADEGFLVVPTDSSGEAFERAGVALVNADGREPYDRADGRWRPAVLAEAVLDAFLAPYRPEKEEAS